MVRLGRKGTMMGGRKKRRQTRSGRRRLGSTLWAERHGEYHAQIRAWFAARVASEQDADDLAEEVVARLARAGAPQDPKAYIATVAANALARYWRRRAKDRDFLLRLVEETTGADEMRGREPKDQSGEDELSEIRARVENILSTLPPGEAQLLRLRFLDGLSVAAVARRARCSQKAAHKRLERILRRLRERYAVEPPTPGDRKHPKNS